MAALTWDTLQTTLLAALSASQPPYSVIPPSFATLFPQATSYAEGRIYKDIVLLATRAIDTSLVTMPGMRAISMATMALPCVVPESVALITPAGQGLAAGTQNQYDESSLDAIDMVWPTQSVTMSPPSALWIGRRWALVDNQTIVLAPTPDAIYVVVVTGLFQPTPIGPSNQSTYLSTIYPELLTAACMVFLTGALQHNFSAQGDEPASSLSWEAEYMKLKTAAQYEEMRRRGLNPNFPPPPS